MFSMNPRRQVNMSLALSCFQMRCPRPLRTQALNSVEVSALIRSCHIGVCRSGRPPRRGPRPAPARARRVPTRQPSAGVSSTSAGRSARRRRQCFRASRCLRPCWPCPPLPLEPAPVAMRPPEAAAPPRPHTLCRARRASRQNPHSPRPAPRPIPQAAVKAVPQHPLCRGSKAGPQSGGFPIKAGSVPARAPT